MPHSALRPLPSPARSVALWDYESYSHRAECRKELESNPEWVAFMARAKPLFAVSAEGSRHPTRFTRGKHFICAHCMFDV